MDDELRKEAEKLLKPMCRFFADQKRKKLENMAMERAVIRDV